jgi:YjbE family integral membrane protein
VGAIAQMVDPAVWLASIASGWNELGHTTFWVATLKIIWINILLSGDNAVVIALACRGLPRRQRLWGMVLGAGVAVVLRILFTGFVAQLMQLPYLKLVGGLALFYIAAKLLVPDDPDKNEVEAVEHLWRAVRIVAVADIIMSLDNVIAIAMAAQGNMALLVLGLGVSVPLIVAGAALIMALLDRYPILVWAGAALLGWIVGEVIATDPAVAPALARLVDIPMALDMSVSSAVFGWETKVAAQFNLVETAAAALGAALVLLVGRVWRRSKETARRREPVTQPVSEPLIAEPQPREQERVLAE